MIIDQNYIRDLREHSFWNISIAAERIILDEFGKLPDPDEYGHMQDYTEQDILEYIRKIIRDN